MKFYLFPILCLFNLALKAQGPHALRFIEGIELDREMHVERPVEKREKKKSRKSIAEPLVLETAQPAIETFAPIEKCTALQFKYGLMLLYQFTEKYFLVKLKGRKG